MTIALRVTGTLILAVAFKDGLVIAGDEGGVGGETKVKLEGQQKVIRLAPKIVMAACGTPTIVDPKDHSIYYVNVPAVAKKYFDRHAFYNSAEFWNGLVEWLVAP